MTSGTTGTKRDNRDFVLVPKRDNRDISLKRCPVVPLSRDGFVPSLDFFQLSRYTILMNKLLVAIVALILSSCVMPIDRSVYYQGRWITEAEYIATTHPVTVTIEVTQPSL